MYHDFSWLLLGNRERIQPRVEVLNFEEEDQTLSSFARSMVKSLPFQVRDIKEMVFLKIHLDRILIYSTTKKYNHCFGDL